MNDIIEEENLVLIVFEALGFSVIFWGGPSLKYSNGQGGGGNDGSITCS